MVPMDEVTLVRRSFHSIEMVRGGNWLHCSSTTIVSGSLLLSRSPCWRSESRRR